MARYAGAGDHRADEVMRRAGKRCAVVRMAMKKRWLLLEQEPPLGGTAIRGFRRELRYCIAKWMVTYNSIEIGWSSR